MAMGRTFQESLQKALRGLETGIDGLTPLVTKGIDLETVLRREMKIPGADRIRYVADAFRHGFDLVDIKELTGIDPWFLSQIQEIIRVERRITNIDLNGITKDEMFSFKQRGFSDSRLASLVSETESKVRDVRLSLGVRPVYKRVDTCAAEFETATAYMYSTYESECEAKPTNRNKIIVLGGGPNRIGQGIEFDYCCVHAAMAMREDGYETIMINCNPETVSTDYDTSDRLYFEPLTLEDVLSIVDLEKPKGLIVQFGGQTPLKLARDLELAGVPIMGTSPDAIDRAEDRERFQEMITALGLMQPPNKTIKHVEEGIDSAKEIGYPLVVRPSYVLGGRAMEIVHDDDELTKYMQEAVQVSDQSPVLLDRFLDQAIEVDIDAVCDGEDVVIGSIMEHIEQAGVHSGDSACSLPPYSLTKSITDEMKRQVKEMALELKVVGLMNVQLAVQNNEIYVLEVNPRASRTVPFVSKCIGKSLAKVAARCMAGISLPEQRFTEEIIPEFYNVKEAVFPFGKFPGVDPILGPEMKSTGEVMGVGKTFGEAYSKAQAAAGDPIPEKGCVFVSVRDADKFQLPELAQDLLDLGFTIFATRGSARTIADAGMDVQIVNKVIEGRPHVVDMLKNKQIDFIINTTEGKQAIADSFTIRRTALQQKVCYTTTMAGGRASIEAVRHGSDVSVHRLQDLHLSIP